jgi:hypothetical protein
MTLDATGSHEAKEVEVNQRKLPLEENERAAAQKIWFIAAPMGIIGWTIALYIVKCVLVDKVVRSLVMWNCTFSDANKLRTWDPVYCRQLDAFFTTDDLGPHLASVFSIVVAFYFGRAAIVEVASIVKR